VFLVSSGRCGGEGVMGASEEPRHLHFRSPSTFVSRL
jgi:hypothetical protein